jgi:type IV pilus assembly protein PilA
MKRADDRSVTRLQHDRRGAQTRARGFTLIELLITVAMIGVLAALGLVGYRRYVHAAQSSEARTVIGMIRGGQEAYKAEMLQYLNCSTSLTDYYPNKTPNDSRMNWIQPGDARYTSATTGWALLNVAPDTPVRFGYAVVANIGGQLTATTALANPPIMPTVATGVPWYVIQAINDHDNNGIYAVFASTSTSGEIMSQNEQE